MRIQWLLTSKHYNRYQLTFLTVAMLVLLATSCSKKKLHVSAVVNLDTLAVVSGRVITTEDFFRRAEYTIRPDYYTGSGYIHKKIILNSLIAEKLFALEQLKKDDLTKNENITAFLTGRKEQAMRQLYFYDQIYSQIKLSDRDLKRAYTNGGRTVHVQYFNIPGEETAEEVRTALQDGISFEEIFSVFSDTGPIPERDVSWLNRNEDKNVIEGLFHKDMKKNAVIGPLKAGDGSILLLKVKSWTDRVFISEQDQRKNWEDSYDRLKEIRARSVYEDRLEGLMAGKQIVFNEPVYIPYVRAVAEYYLKSQEETREFLNEKLWELKPGSINQKAEKFPRELKHETLFTMDGENFSIDDLENLLKVHPLVFRKKKMNLPEFPGEFQKAVADLIQDLVLTEECYRLEYHKSVPVLLNQELWYDAILAESMKWNIITGVTDTLFHLQEPGLKIEKVLDPKVRELQEKYSESIKIDMKKFESIELTNTPMVVIQPGQPFPVIVPQFPVITMLSRLNYGSDMSRDRLE